MQEVVKVNNQEVAVIEWNHERVITTAQLADIYETDINNVQANFGRNHERFEQGKHFYLLKGAELQEFKNHLTDSQVVARNTAQLYLWTKRGASRHCKILDTEKAWEQFDYLEEAYFNPDHAIFDGISEELRAAIVVDKRVTKVEHKLDAVNEDLQQFKEDMPILGIEEDRITTAVRRKGVQCLGGKHSNAYNDKSLRGKLYSDLYKQVYRQFGITTYKAIKRNQCDIAIGIIESYEPPFILSEQIVNCNAQMNLGTEVA